MSKTVFAASDDASGATVEPRAHWGGHSCPSSNSSLGRSISLAFFYVANIRHALTKSPPQPASPGFVMTD